MPCVTRVICTRLMDHVSLFCRSVPFFDQFAWFCMTCTYIFRSLFRFFFILVFCLSGGAQVFNRRCLSGIVFLGLIRTSFRAAFRVQRTRFGRYDGGAANEGVIANRGRAFVCWFLCDRRYITRVFEVLCDQCVIACFIR